MKVLIVDQIAMVNYKYSFSLAKALEKQGIDLTMIVDEKEPSKLYHFKMENLFKTSNKNISKIKKVFNYISSMRYIVNKAILEQYDIVHVQWFQFSPIDYLELRKLKKHNIRIIVTIHDILPFNEKLYDRYFHKKLYNVADSIILQAKSNVKRFRDLFPNEAFKTILIPHGNFLDFSDIKTKEDSIKKLGIPEDKFVFLFFGQIKKVKGLDLLLEAFAKLCKERSDCYLVIAGSVWKDDFDFYQKIIEDNHIGKYVKTDIKYIPDDDVGYYYGASDISVLPYKDVYQSGVVQLSYAHNTPVIGSDIGAFREVVLDKKTGYLFENNNVENLYKVMKYVVDNKNKIDLEGMTNQGKGYIKEKFSWEKIAKQIKSECYKSENIREFC